ncbi:MAG: hypothetical protein AAF740_03125 [Bacteroidota bacterium]
MHKLGRFILRGVIYVTGLITLFVILYLNFRFYTLPNCNPQDGVNTSIEKQLNYLKDTVSHGAAEQMQTIYPEGFHFMYALYGLAWAEYLLVRQKEVQADELAEIDRSIYALLSDKGKKQFDPNLPLAYGVFYQGWSTYLVGKRLELTRDSLLEKEFHDRCQKIALAFEQSDSPFLESYNGMVWPADNTICIAALALSDRLYATNYHKEIEIWLSKVESRLDTKTGLIPHSSEPKTGSFLEGARGSSISLMLGFLPEIDSAFAQSQFEQYKKHFLTTRAGFRVVSEYPKGDVGSGDVDSGPVIWGVSGSGSLAGLNALSALGKDELNTELATTIEVLGCPLPLKSGQKTYAFGHFPMADAFIAWGNASKQVKNSASYFMLPSLISVLIAGGIVVVFYRVKSR